MSFRTEYNDCTVDEIPWKLTLGYVSMGLPKDSTYHSFLNLHLTDLYISGKLRELQDNWSIHLPQCKSTNIIKPISLEKIISSLIGLVLGFTMAFVSMVFESILKKFIMGDEEKVSYKPTIKQDLAYGVQRIRNLRNTFGESNVNSIISELGNIMSLEQESETILDNLN